MLISNLKPHEASTIKCVSVASAKTKRFNKRILSYVYLSVPGGGDTDPMLVQIHTAILHDEKHQVCSCKTMSNNIEIVR